jgi:hypothetical protein
MICENTQASLLLQVSQGVLWHAVASDLWAREKGERAVALSEFFQYLQFALRISES